jgi:hypothetical protein
MLLAVHEAEKAGTHIHNNKRQTPIVLFIDEDLPISKKRYLSKQKYHEMNLFGSYSDNIQKKPGAKGTRLRGSAEGGMD